MRLGIPVYEGVDLLDVAGPAEMFYWAGKDQPLETLILSEDGGPVTAMNGIRFEVQASFADVSALDVLWVPGGDPEVLGQIMSDPGSPYLAYLRQVAEDATWVCSVCEGALLLAQAGLLDGHRATTHWAFIACLQRFCEIDVDTGNPRFVVSGNRLTGGGISSGLDESFQLILMLFGQEAAESVQVTTQYFPDPPVMGTLPPTPACPVTWS
ncbi:DJ-1/PfpI family protein [Caulobacter rhizosphaerae]|jgi:cyclohexyl-isocyanide hydratase|uniref:DJ-1/PfpI family protein n=1 Tax=Caulobacter rhizosphaerae TaxID=2010972 RepID=UPI0013D565C4|nr:DJ-1/PfpI family protein [Caulobacter rhizosphaerae]GGL26072.1 transcriptional regulator [Caulobacter rhizosphaerae]